MVTWLVHIQPRRMYRELQVLDSRKWVAQTTHNYLLLITDIIVWWYRHCNCILSSWHLPSRHDLNSSKSCLWWPNILSCKHLVWETNILHPVHLTYQAWSVSLFAGGTHSWEDSAQCVLGRYRTSSSFNRGNMSWSRVPCFRSAVSAANASKSTAVWQSNTTHKNCGSAQHISLQVSRAANVWPGPADDLAEWVGRSSSPTHSRMTIKVQTSYWLASFPGRRRNGLATSASSNCYFRCLKVGSTNHISERSHMTTVKLNCVMHWTVAVTPIPLQ